MKKFLKKSRKGFTLVELLIVIIILGALAATMMLNSGKSVANAKANTIISNMSTIKYAALQYYADNTNAPKIATFKASADLFLGELAGKGKGTNGDSVMKQGNVTYDAVQGSDKTEAHWYVKASIGSDPDKDDIKDYLAKQAEAASLLKDNTGKGGKYDGNTDDVFMSIR